MKMRNVALAKKLNKICFSWSTKFTKNLKGILQKNYKKHKTQLLKVIIQFKWNQETETKAN